MTKKERNVLLILASAQFCNIMDFMIMMPLGDLLMNLFKITPRQFSFLVSAYTLSAGVSGFVIAFFADRFDRRRLLSWMYTGFTVGTLACALAPTYEFLLLARLITGVFGGVIGSIVLAIAADLVPMKSRGEAMGIVNMAFSTASVFGVPFGLLLASQISWHAPFLFIVAVSVPVNILIMRKVPRMDRHLSNERVAPVQVLRNIWENSNQVKALLFVCTLMFAHFSIIPFLSPTMVANVGFTQSQLTWIYFLGGAVSIVTGPWFGRLADRMGKQDVFTWACVAAFVPVLWITHMGPTPLPVALAVTTLFFIVSGGRMIPAFALSSGTVKPKNRGSFMSLQSSLQQLSLAAASFLAGLVVIKDEASGRLLNYQYVGYAAVVFGAVCLWLVRRIKVVDEHAEAVILE